MVSAKVTSCPTSTVALCVVKLEVVIPIEETGADEALEVGVVVDPHPAPARAKVRRITSSQMPRQT
jgi:hypothetical protein